MAEQYAPIAKDESFNTTDLTPKNIADVLKDGLQNIADSVKPTADEIPFDPTGTSLVSTDVEGAIKELGLVKKGTVTFTTGADGTWTGTVYVDGYPLKSGELLSAYLNRGSLSAFRNIEYIMYGGAGYQFKCTDSSNNPIASTEVTVTCVYLKTT